MTSAALFVGAPLHHGIIKVISFTPIFHWCNLRPCCPVKNLLRFFLQLHHSDNKGITNELSVYRPDKTHTHHKTTQHQLFIINLQTAAL